VNVLATVVLLRAASPLVEQREKPRDSRHELKSSHRRRPIQDWRQHHQSPWVRRHADHNLVDRGSEDVLAYCAANNIGFIPWFPLAAGELIQPGGLVDRIARARGATTGQVALAWLLKRSPVILPIPGTLQVAHLEENVAAAGLSLTPEEFAELDAAP
jgi:aryl-alcohol dehydrogenase-like predicted oxidoreductase